MRRSGRQIIAVPVVALELHRCRRDLATTGLNPSLARARSRSRRPLGRFTRRLTPDELSGVVLRLARSSPLSTVCLPRALALWVVLRRTGRESELRIGVPRDDPRGEMHAWVELDGVTIGDQPDVSERFLPFDLRGKLPDDVVGRSDT